MARHDTFTLRVNKQERAMLEKLAARLQRSQSDALRVLVREAVAQLDTKEGAGTEAGVRDARR